MSLVGSMVTPHPPVIIPEVGGHRLRDVQATVDSMHVLGERSRECKPDTLIVLSPHAPVSADHMGVGVAATYRGSLVQFGAPEIAVEFGGNVGLAEAVLEESLAMGVPAMRLGDGRGPAGMDHGALVPLHFAAESLPRPPQLVLLSFSFLPAEDHLSFGRAIGRAVDAAGERVLYIASGDLSHRLTRDAPAGYNPLGEEFDQRVVQAFENDDPGSLVDFSPALLQGAGECGYRSLVVLAGLLEGRRRNTEVLSYEGPFGVGYLVAWIGVEPEGPKTEEGVE